VSSVKPSPRKHLAFALRTSLDRLYTRQAVIFKTCVRQAERTTGRPADLQASGKDAYAAGERLTRTETNPLGAVRPGSTEGWLLGTESGPKRQIRCEAEAQSHGPSGEGRQAAEPLVGRRSRRRRQ
jgi:hypothetical protein